MKQMLRNVSLAVIISGACAACTLHADTPPMRADLPGDVTITVPGGRDYPPYGRPEAYGKHCPPGHAKKGWCR